MKIKISLFIGFLIMLLFTGVLSVRPVLAQEAVEWGTETVSSESQEFPEHQWDPDTESWQETGNTETMTITTTSFVPKEGGNIYIDANGNKSNNPNQDFGQGILTEIGYVANNTRQSVIDAIRSAGSRGEKLSIAGDCFCWRSTFGDGGDGGSPFVFVPPTPTPTPVPPAGNWLKVVGGDVYSGGRINMTVPPPAGQYNATGVVTSGSSISNFQTVSNWVIQNYSITSGKYDYEYFFKRFKSKALPLSTHITNSTSLDDETIYLYDQLGDFLLESNGANFNNKKIAILINGNLRIQSTGNKFTPQNASVIFITSGNVIIDSNMTEINAAIVSTGNTSTGTGTIPLTIKGLLVSYGGFSLGRAPSSSATAGETVIYDPNLVVTLNDLIGMTNFFWQEVAP